MQVVKTPTELTYPAVWRFRFFVALFYHNPTTFSACIHDTTACVIKLAFHDADTATPTRASSRGSSPTRPTRAISWSYSCGKLNDTPTFSRRSSRGCRCRCRGMRAIRGDVARIFGRGGAASVRRRIGDQHRVRTDHISECLLRHRVTDRRRRQVQVYRTSFLAAYDVRKHTRKDRLMCRIRQGRIWLVGAWGPGPLPTPPP